MGLFYAYFQCLLQEADSRSRGKFLITFADGETADEWWRTISTYPSPFVGWVERISPQFYTQTTGNYIVANLSEDLARKRFPQAAEVLKKVSVVCLDFLKRYDDGGYEFVFNSPDRTVTDSRLFGDTSRTVPANSPRPPPFAPNDKISCWRSLTAPPIEAIDYISGRWYFIRSQDDPERHWYHCLGDRCLVCERAECDIIHVSTNYRTRFCVRVRDTYCQPSENLVMIGTDEVSIAPSKEHILCIGNASRLVVTKSVITDAPFHFRDLKHGFASLTEGDFEYVNIVPTNNVGEAWELSD